MYSEFKLILLNFMTLQFFFVSLDIGNQIYRNVDKLIVMGVIDGGSLHLINEYIKNFRV